MTLDRSSCDARRVVYKSLGGREGGRDEGGHKPDNTQPIVERRGKAFVLPSLPPSLPSLRYI